MIRIRKKEMILISVFFVGIGLGTVTTILFASLLEITIYDPDIKDQIQAMTDFWGLFFYIVQSRFWELAACILLSMTVIAYPIFCVLSGYSGFCMACIVGMATMTYGTRGIFAFLAVILPHYLFYGTGIVLLMLQSCQQLPLRYAVMSYLIIIGIFLLGMLSEAWCNPWLLRFM